MYGFYITQKGADKIASAIQAGGSVSINTCAVGDGGDVDAERDYNIITLKHETYRKTLDSEDSYSMTPGSDDTIMISTVIPNDAGELTINEIGYFDYDDDLIIYGVTKDKIHKANGALDQEYIVELVNFIEVTPNVIEALNIDLGKATLQSISDRVDLALEDITTFKTQITNNYNDLEPRVVALETDLEGMAEFLESRI